MKIRNHAEQLLGIFLGVFFAYMTFADAVDLTSTSFIVRDPVVNVGGQYGTSTSFGLFSGGDTVLNGVGSSATYIGHFGPLYFPFIYDGALSVTPSGSTINLSWGASTAGGGWSVSGYNVGKATISGGPYTYTAVGNVTSYAYTDQSPGEYCFVLQTLDAVGNVIYTSAESCTSITPTLTFANDDAAIGFGTLSSGAPTYANGAATGSGSATTAHTFTIGTNAPTGYTLTYNGATLTSGSNTITPATITGSATGTAGSSQFALGATVTGTGTAVTAYNAASNNWKFVAATTDTVASATGPVTSDSVAMRYIANIPASQAAGVYSTDLTYIITPNF